MECGRFPIRYAPSHDKPQAQAPLCTVLLLLHNSRERLLTSTALPFLFLPLPQDGVPNPAALAAREAALVRLRRKPREVAAHVELLEGAKAHLDRLLGRCAGGPVDHLVLLAAMGAMRVKLLEDATEVFRVRQGVRELQGGKRLRTGEAWASAAVLWWATKSHGERHAMDALGA